MKWNQLLALGMFAVPLFLAGQAHAEEQADQEGMDSLFVIGVDGHLLGTLDSGEFGGGFAGRVGWHYTAAKILAFRPEFGVGYNDADGEDFGRVFGGARVGVQFLVGLYAYGHVGYGWGPTDGLTYDVGAAADLLLWFFRPGIHLDYVRIVDDVSAVRGGVHLELAF